MTATTTLKLPEALKHRIAPLASAAGRTPHAWMLEALEASRPGQFRWDALLEGPASWVGLLRRLRPDEAPMPVRRLSPRLAPAELSAPTK